MSTYSCDYAEKIGHRFSLAPEQVKPDILRQLAKTWTPGGRDVSSELNTAADRLEAELQRSEVERDPRWEWHLVQRLGMPDMWVKARCLHTEVVPVESVTGEVVAQLCLTCDTQFVAPA